MKMKCVKCGGEYAVRKAVAAKRFEKGITEENYLCRACRPKAVKTPKAPKKVAKKVAKKLPLRDAKGRFAPKAKV